MISSFKNILVKIQPNMSEQERKQQWIYYFPYAETKQKFLCMPYTKNIFTLKEIFIEREERWIE